MKLPKCEIVLPRGYRWVKKGEDFKKGDLSYRWESNKGQLEWIIVSSRLCMFCPTAISRHMAIRKIK